MLLQMFALMNAHTCKWKLPFHASQYVSGKNALLEQQETETLWPVAFQ